MQHMYFLLLDYTPPPHSLVELGFVNMGVHLAKTHSNTIILPLNSVSFNFFLHLPRCILNKFNSIVYHTMPTDLFDEYSSDFVDRMYEIVMHVVRWWPKLYQGFQHASDVGRPAKEAAPPPLHSSLVLRGHVTLEAGVLRAPA
jgi:hypothetical protein